MNDMPQVEFAGFWRRFNAYGIDGTLVLLLSVLIDWLLGGYAHAQSAQDLQTLNAAIAALQGGAVDPSLQHGMQDGLQAALMRSMLGGNAISLVNEHIFMAISALYNITFVASHWQATPGKHWLKLKVTMAGGRRLTWAESIARHLMSGVSMLMGGLGYITLFFTREKLALHDMICQTRVMHIITR